MMREASLVSAVLADPDVRRRIASQIRRRVPAGDVEDVAQNVMCEALASAPAGLREGDVPRWLAGIARHKACDLHRRRARREVAGEGAIDAAPAPAPPHEQREILRGILSEAGEGGADHRVLDWIVREHEGERLNDIARQEGLPAHTVRKRISRFRQRLRSQWLGVLALVLVGGALAGAASRERRREDIVAEPVAASAVALLGAAQGSYRVVGSTPAPDLDVATATAARVELQDMTITVEGQRVTVRSLGFHGKYMLQPRAPGALSLQRVDTGEELARITVHEGGAVVVHASRGTLRGTLVLARR
jgi:DNA-directed RNA polymerase specialized sigma24 family protein